MTGVTVSLQVDALLPTVPPGLGSALVVTGLTVMLGRRIRTQVARLDRRIHAAVGGGFRHGRLVAGSLAAGILFLTIGGIQRYDLVVPVVAVLFFLGNVITGAAHVRTWQKIVAFCRERAVGGDLTRTIRYGLLSIFVVVGAGTLLIYRLRSGTGDAGLVATLAVVWTVLTFGLSVVGLSKRVLPLRDQVDERLLYGFVLAVAGTEVFDLTVALYVGFLVVGMVGYGVGFWAAVYYWLVA